jgi:hypothetical protein
VSSCFGAAPRLLSIAHCDGEDGRRTALACGGSREALVGKSGGFEDLLARFEETPPHDQTVAKRPDLKEVALDEHAAVACRLS